MSLSKELKLKTSLLFCVVLFISLAGCMQQKKAEPETVIAPESTPSKVDTSDSTYLRVTLTDKEYKISLLNDSLITTDINGVDSFITDKKAKIIEDKIVVTGDQGSNFNAFKQLLKKHNYTRFRMD